MPRYLRSVYCDHPRPVCPVPISRCGHPDLQACTQNATFCSSCSRTYSAVGFCFIDYAWCYPALCCTQAAGSSLATFCSNSSLPGIQGATFAGYAMSCPCWCARFSPP